MAGLTPTGLVIKSLNEIIDSINTKAVAAYGTNFNTAEDSSFGIAIGVISAEIADAWQGVQGVYDASFPGSSTGINLDNVADLVGVTRLAAQKSTGYVKFKGDTGTVIPQNTLILNTNTNTRFLTDANHALNISALVEAYITVTTVANNTLYTVTIDSTAVNFTSDGSATATEIVDGLVSNINTAALGFTASNVSNVLTLIRTDQTESSAIAVSANLAVPDVANIIATSSEDFGAIEAAINSLTTLAIPIFGIDSITNVAAFSLGRLEETDSELRQRRFESVSIAGGSTFDAIRSAVGQVSGVTKVLVVENEGQVPDADGRPGKSFEVIVSGGQDKDIAQTIWNDKPVGIETFGSTSVTALDTEGNPHTVKFSRPTTKYVHFDIDYSLFSEEAFPPSGETAMKQAVVDFGNTLTLDNDIIAQRFFGPIYSSVPGIGNLVVRVAVSNDGITPGAYTTGIISIKKTEIPSFAVSRVMVTKV